MFQRTKLGTSLLLAFGSVVAGSSVYAQSTAETQRVEVTGSAIKRIQAEGSLPVTVINRAAIEQSGVTSVTDLVQALPSMQGFTTSSQSVNGGGGGTTTASLHGLGSKYTLVLLNGRRVAPFNTGGTVNLESIPLAAIERVEVLTDGASAIYGSDAIAGVINFILRKNSTVGEISANIDHVEAGGGGNKSFSISKGFGDLETNGFNVMLSLSAEQTDQLKASQRSFASSGIIKGIDGKNLGLRLSSSNSVPGNVYVYSVSGEDDVFYSPYLQKTGACPANHFAAGTICRYDFSSQVDLVPESRQVSGLISGRFKLGADHQLFAEGIFSSFSNKPTFAPAAQPGLKLTQALYDKHVAPYLGNFGLTSADVLQPGDADGLGPEMYYRGADAGGRRDKYTYDTAHLTIGAEGAFGNWDYSTWLTMSQQKFSDQAIGGYMSKDRFDALIASGAYDPLDAVAGTSAKILAPAILNDVFTKDKSTYNSFGLRGSGPLFDMAGGKAMIAAGLDAAVQTYTSNPSAISMGANKLQPNYTDAIIGGSGGALPFDTSRASAGLFGEIAMPVLKNLDLSAAARFDTYGAAKNARRFDTDGTPLPGEASEGNSSSAGTFKLSARFAPSKSVLVRGSVGTGFKAPSLANITSPLQSGGVTTGSYDCPFTGADPLAAGCRPPDSQYQILSGGNAATGAGALKPEKSTQFTFGTRIEPVDGISIGLDYWNVKLKDQISTLDEALAFANPTVYRSLFTIAREPVSGTNQLTFISRPINLTSSAYSGIDLDATMVSKTAAGKLTTNVQGTYMLKAEYEVPGSGTQSSLGKFGADNSVTFRWQLKGTLALDSGDWTNALSANYKSGYQDHVAGLASGPEVRTINPTTGAFGGRVAYTRQVAEYLTFDWQTAYRMSKALSLTVGIRNLTDQDPPFSMQDAGGGNMRGYDGRYADPVGRTYYVKANYKF